MGALVGENVGTSVHGSGMQVLVCGTQVSCYTWLPSWNFLNPLVFPRYRFSLAAAICNAGTHLFKNLMDV